MNADTVNLIERPYPEIVDDILTAIVGGVVNEPIFFDVKDDLYPLAQPARDVRGVTGSLTVNGADGEPQQIHQVFQKTVDFVFSESDNAVIWQPDGKRPDDETLFYVDYFRRESRSPLSDINVGSVTRTLSEAVGREIATVYQQINQAYLSGFVDTATGKSLELVVSILGVRRITKEFATGLVTFFRDPAAGDGNITIAQDTVLSAEKDEASFVTVEPRTLQRGQARIDVPARAGGKSKGEAGLVKAGAITRLAQPITGIARVTNFEDTILAAEDETDEQLRARAKLVLRGAGKATLAALIKAITEGRGKLVEAFDPNSEPEKRTPEGTVTLLIEAEPERFPSLRAAVEETRAAGVMATLVARYVFFKPRIRAVLTDKNITAAGKDKVKSQIIGAMQKYVDGLGAGDPSKGAELLKAIRSVKEVSAKPEETKIVDVIVTQSDIVKPGPERLTDALLNAVNTVLSDPATTVENRQTGLRTTLEAILKESGSSAPTALRKSNRALLQGESGQRATDAEIEAGKFQVSAIVEGDKWSVALDITPDDIALEG